MSSAPRVSRRGFLGAGVGIGGAALAFALRGRLAWAQEAAAPAAARLRFGPLDPLVDLIQETPADALVPQLIVRLRAGTTLQELAGAAALANVRALGSTDYNGYHALMAMAPGFELAAQMAPREAALPVLKVVHRSARFVQAAGKSGSDVLAPIDGAEAGDVVEAARRFDRGAADRRLAAAMHASGARTFESLQPLLRDDANVHRVVLAWRALDLRRLAGEAQATTLCRQFVRFCIENDAQRKENGQAPSALGPTVERLMDEQKLRGRARGRRRADDAWIAQLAGTVFSASSKDAAEAVAGALAEGFEREDVGAALTLAATRLVLHDRGQLRDSPGKPKGSVHGASVGVHASDAANAWRHLARVLDDDDACATLIAGAFHTAGQAQFVGADPFDAGTPACAKSDPEEILAELEGAVRRRDQQAACAAARRHGELGHPPEALFARLLPFAVSDDGALHHEKYFRTVQEEHALARAAHRGDLVVALARVVTSGSGFPAPGVADARALLSA